MSKYEACRQVSLALADSHGWQMDQSGMRAEKRTPAGVFSLGLDGTVKIFERHAESGYPIEDLDLGTVSFDGAPESVAARVAALIAA